MKRDEISVKGANTTSTYEFLQQLLQGVALTHWVHMQRAGKASSERRRSVGLVRDTLHCICGTFVCTICATV